MPLRTRIHAARTAVVQRRTERRAYRRLADELASFRTPAERAELDELLARQHADETEEIRAILNRLDHERLLRSSVAGGALV